MLLRVLNRLSLLRVENSTPSLNTSFNVSSSLTSAALQDFAIRLPSYSYRIVLAGCMYYWMVALDSELVSLVANIFSKRFTTTSEKSIRLQDWLSTLFT